MSEAHVLSLFDSPGKVETATPGATVWLARDPSSGRPALIKRLKNAGSKARVTAALSLKHPAIVPTRRWLLDEGQLYVVRDVPRGKNLRQVIGATRPEPEALRRYVTPLLDALALAHSQQSAHGGVSLENLIVAESGDVLLCDFGTTDPSEPRHRPFYAGSASAEGDIRAAAALIAGLLPSSGNFAIATVRARIEGIVLRCNSLDDLRETLTVLEKLAAAPLPTPKATTPPKRTATGPPPLSTLSAPPEPERSVNPNGVPRLIAVVHRPDPVLVGGNGAASVELKNDGDATLIVRMVASQHAWLNVRPTALPITLPPGASTRIGFLVQAARLSPGEYRSEVYLSANAAGPGAEDLRSGWFKHTLEVRVAVVAPGVRR